MEKPWGPLDLAGGTALNIRRLLLPLILAFVSVHAGQAGAQGTLPPPQSEAQCMKGFAPLREEWERRGKLIKAASARHAPPDEACKLISDFRQAETTMIKYIEANSAKCGIPPQIADQLKAKRVDAVESLEPFAGALRANGNVSIATPLLSVGKDVLFPFWISQGAWARANLPTIKAWIAALEDAKSFIEKNPAEARKIMAQYTKLPEAVVQATPFPTYRFAIKPQDIQVWAAALRDVGQLDKEVDSSKLVVTP